MNINLVAIAGAGTMGAGIAQTSAVAGYETLLYDITEEARQRGMESIKTSLTRLTKKEKITEDEKAEALARITLVGDIEQFEQADIVIEAIYENLKAKEELWQKIDKVAKENCLFATNTSSLSVTEIASFTNRAGDFVGMHFFNPVAMMPLVEVIRGLGTNEDRLEHARMFAESLGKTAIVCQDKPGFIVNRILIPYINDSIHALSEGVASAEDIDKAMKLGANMPIGPLALADLVGLDVALAAGEALYSEFEDSKFRVSPLLKQMVRAGKLGRKTGEGFYKYE